MCCCVTLSDCKSRILLKIRVEICPWQRLTTLLIRTKSKIFHFPLLKVSQKISQFVFELIYLVLLSDKLFNLTFKWPPGFASFKLTTLAQKQFQRLLMLLSFSTFKNQLFTQHKSWRAAPVLLMIYCANSEGNLFKFKNFSKIFHFQKFQKYFTCMDFLSN